MKLSVLFLLIAFFAFAYSSSIIDSRNYYAVEEDDANESEDQEDSEYH